MKIAVSVGHTLSGADTGAAGYLNESKCTREIGELVKNKLESQGHSVVYCRIDNASSVNSSLSYRVNKANASNVDLFIEIHLNAGGGTGAETWICGTGGVAEKYARNIANSICELGYYNRGVKVGNLYVTRNTNAPAVLIECCFVDSKSDSEKYNADKIANKIVKGITGQEIETPKLNYDYIALEQCNIVDSKGTVTGALWIGERCEKEYITEDYKKYVKYLNGNKTIIKKGLVETNKTSKVIPIDEAYNAYNSYNDTINVSGNEEFKGDVLGVVYANEKILKLSDANEYGNVKIAFDSSFDGKLGRIGYVPSKCISIIEDKPPEEESNILYRVYAGTFTKKENAESLVNDLKEKGFDACIKIEEK